MNTIPLKANGPAFADAHVTAEAGLVKVLVQDNTTRMGLHLELNPETAVELARAILESAREAQFTRLDKLTGKGGAQ